MILFLEHLLVVLGVLLVALAMILVLQPRRTPQSAVAWILFIIALPYLAVPLFLTLGFRKQRRRAEQIRFAAEPETMLDPAPPQAAQLFRSLGGSAVTTGNRFQLHASPEVAGTALQDMIGQAERQIEVLLYILADDASGRTFVRALTERAAAGVTVRLALDRFATFLHRPRADLRRFVQAGGELRFVSPVLALRGAGGLNLRNHRKLVVVDGIRVWAGGRNVADAYFRPDHRPSWLDLSFSAEGPIARAWAEVFAADWHLAGGPLLEPPPPLASTTGTQTLQLVPAGPDESRDVLHDGLVSAIHRAESRVWIATPYFVPTEMLALALATAARAGRDVRILLPEKSNQWTADLARGAYLREMARAGCRILRFQPGMMHAKAGLIDDWGWIGSANFDVRSMLLNFETVLMAYDATSAAALEDWFEGLLPLCAEGLHSAPLPRRLVEGIFRLGAPIL